MNQHIHGHGAEGKGNQNRKGKPINRVKNGNKVGHPVMRN